MKFIKSLRWILFTLAVLGLLFIVTRLLFLWLTTNGWGWLDYGNRIRFVEQEIDKTLVELPQLKQLDLLGTYQETFSSHQHLPKVIQHQLKQEGIPPCYYARTYFIYGTQTPGSEVLDLYVENLYSQGWHSVTSLSGSTYFLRGDNEKLHFDQALEWTFYYDDIGFDYDEMSRKYDELISVRVDYAWPKQSGC